MNSYTILLICTANLIRSPIAETLLQNYLSRIAPEVYWKIDSAGIWAKNGTHIPEAVCNLLQKRNLTKKNPQAKIINSFLMENFSLILTMEKRQKDILITEFPHFKKKIFMLSEMSNFQIDVHDPDLTNLESLIRCIDEIDQWILSGIPMILEKVDYLGLSN